MYEKELSLNQQQVQAVCQAAAGRSIRSVYCVACGGSLATLYPGKYILERRTDKVEVQSFNAAEFTADPPARLGEGCLVLLNSQSGGTRETVEAARLCAQRGALTVAFTTKPGSAIEQAADCPVYYYDDPLNPYPTVLTVFPTVYKVVFALLDLWNGTELAPSMAESLLRLQDTFDAAMEQHQEAARAFAAAYSKEPLIYSVSAGLDSCVGYVLTNCLVMESLWKHSSPLHAGEFFHGAFEAVDDTTAVFALLGLGGTRLVEERAVKFLQRKTKKLTVLDAKALDLSAYPNWQLPYLAPLVLNRLAAQYCDEMSYVMGHPISSRRYMGVEVY